MPLSSGRPNPKRATCAGSLGAERGCPGVWERARPAAGARGAGPTERAPAPRCAQRVPGHRRAAALGARRDLGAGERAPGGTRKRGALGAPGECASPEPRRESSARAPVGPGGRRVGGPSRHPGRGPSAGDDARRSCTGRERAGARELAGPEKPLALLGQYEVGAAPRAGPGTREPGRGPVLKLPGSWAGPSRRHRSGAVGRPRGPRAGRLQRGPGLWRGERGGCAEAAAGGAVDAVVESTEACVSRWVCERHPQSGSPGSEGTAVDRLTPSCCNSEESLWSPRFSSYYLPSNGGCPRFRGKR